MLLRLSIQNYAIINELEIDFSGRLNIITGETGAGKSIIVGALGLILGERADTTVLVNKDKKCIVEGVFKSGDKKQVALFLQAQDLEFSDEIVVRREIATNGKSRAFINDSPVTLSQLGDLSSWLVDLHQQFDTRSIGESEFQREVVDALAGTFPILEEYQPLFLQWQTVTSEIAALRASQQQLEKESDYHRFQFTELEEAGFKEHELEEAEMELKRMSHSEGIKNALNKVYHELAESETPLTQQLKSLANLLHPYTAFHTQLPELLQRMHTAQVELQDVAGELDHISQSIQYHADKVEELQERLSLGYRLQKKHGVKSTGELLDIRKQLEETLANVQGMDDTIAGKEKEAEKMWQTLTGLAANLSAGRSTQLKPLEEQVNKLLRQVGMPGARLKVEMKGIPLSHAGTDSIEFLFDANKSGQFQLVRKVASGGELSRLMLAIKSLVAEKIDLPTLIFDEIDTGISGEAARQVGIIMKQLAAKRQVICITHQPQIAGKADAHFFVYKEIIRNTVHTNIRLLTTEERITTIAKMLSGEKPTAAAIENAREMMMN